MVERTFEARNDRPQRGVVVAQQRHNFFRLGGVRQSL